MSAWQPIETAPEDETRFWAGGWFGEPVYDEEGDWKQIGWVGKPEWIEHITHDESQSRLYDERGWNHRNGPFPSSLRVTHWRPLEVVTPPDHGLPVMLQPVRSILL